LAVTDAMADRTPNLLASYGCHDATFRRAANGHRLPAEIGVIALLHGRRRVE
jgi:hypothetical protein